MANFFPCRCYICLQFHKGESDPSCVLFLFLFFFLRRRLCSISFFLREKNNKDKQCTRAKKKIIFFGGVGWWCVLSWDIRTRLHPPPLLEINLGSTPDIVTCITIILTLLDLQEAVSLVFLVVCKLNTPSPITSSLIAYSHTLYLRLLFLPFRTSAVTGFTLIILVTLTTDPISNLTQVRV